MELSKGSLDDDFDEKFLQLVYDQPLYVYQQHRPNRDYWLCKMDI
jgi:hypothetical protein